MPAEDRNRGANMPVPVDPPNIAGGIIDMEVFSQIRDMDDEEEEEGEAGEGGNHEFSKGIVWGYFEQAEQTFKHMEEAIAKKSLPDLHSLGHFLKGSSAALGIIKVQASCEKMQHYGNKRDEEAGVDLTEDEALKRIEALLADCKRDYENAKKWMMELYGEEYGEEDKDEDREGKKDDAAEVDAKAKAEKKEDKK